MNLNRKVYLTPEGKEDLQKELEKLVNVKRPALAKRLKHAIEQGDLSENADYQTAKEEQAFLEGRIQEIEAMLRNVELIHNDGPSDPVTLGSQVTVIEDGLGEPETFRIVGTAETNPLSGKVSHKSPMGQALLDRQVGDKVTVEAPGGGIVFQITEIK